MRDGSCQPPLAYHRTVLCQKCARFSGGVALDSRLPRTPIYCPMGLRTAEQYRNSLRDGRAVFFRGQKVADVTTHPVIGIAVEHAAIDYMMADDPRYRDLAVVIDGGDLYSRYYQVPRSADDLLARSRLIAVKRPSAPPFDARISVANPAATWP